MAQTKKEYYPFDIPSWYTGDYAEGKAPHIGHRQHLCDIALRGEVSLEHIKNMVRDAKFICKKCGRVSVKEENLCDARTLQPSFKT